MDRVEKANLEETDSQPSPSTSSHGTPGQAGQALRDCVVSGVLSRVASCPGRANGRGQLCEQAMGFAPIDAGIGNALPVHQWLAWH
jgi:hypothetical protein